MALTNELIKANVEGLDDATIEKIVTLSANKFAEDIAKRIGELHGQYDSDFASVTGETKPQGLKTYDWGKQLLTNYKTAAEEAKGTIEGLSQEIETLKGQIKTGSNNEALTKQLEDAQNRVQEWEQKYKADIEAANQLVAQEKGRNISLRVDHEFTGALAGVKFKPEDIMPESVRSTFIEAAKAKILNTYKPDWIDNGKGGQVLAFRNSEGQIANNPDKALAPFTAKDLMLKELTPIIDQGKQQPGGGTGPSKKTGSEGSAVSIDFSKVRTKGEALALVQETLIRKGYENASDDYNKEYRRIVQENELSKLPMV